jgi:hypothetical protein
MMKGSTPNTALQVVSKQQAGFMVGVRCSPTIHHVTELQTILIISLRALFGELESHSVGMVVEKTTMDDVNTTYTTTIPTKTKTTADQDNNNHDTSLLSSSSSVSSSCCGDFVIHCWSESAMDAIRSALTMPTLPPYLAGTDVVYRFDTVAFVGNGCYR